MSRTTRMLIAESGAVALAVAFVTQSPGTRFAWCLAGVALIVLAALTTRGLSAIVGPRFRRGPVSADDVVTDSDGAVAIIEIGDSASIIVAGQTRIPHINITRSSGPAVVGAVVVASSPAHRRAFLVIRASHHGMTWSAQELRSSLESAISRATRRLRAHEIPHRRVSGTEFTGAVSHPSIGGSAHVAATVRAPLPSDGVTQPLLVRLVGSPTATTVLTWSRAEAVLRITAASRERLAHEVARVQVLLPSARIEGSLAANEEFDGWRMFTARPARRDHAPGSPSSPNHLGHDLVLPATGLVIGRDRAGELLRVRVGNGASVRICVVGGDRAATILARRAEAAGLRVAPPPVAGYARQGRSDVVGATGGDPRVPLILDLLAAPTAADAAALTSADVVVCQSVPPQVAAIVAGVLALPARVAEWLTRVDGEMVAVIGEGAVRWVMLAEPAAEARASGADLAYAWQT